MMILCGEVYKGSFDKLNQSKRIVTIRRFFSHGAYKPHDFSHWVVDIYRKDGVILYLLSVFVRSSNIQLGSALHREAHNNCAHQK